MAFSSKNDAVSKLTTAITSPSDPKLQPSIGVPIKSGNLQNYIQNLLDWVFPPNPSLIDLRGKVLGVGRVPLTPVTDYSSLEFMTMMPLGGIIMYPLNGINQNVGAGKIRAVLTPSTTQLDGFLFLDGLTIDTTVSGNEIFKDLKVMLTGYYGNTMSDNLLRLPNMRRKVPICYDPTTPTTPAYNNPNIAGSENILNYGQVSNTGGSINVKLTTNQLPTHLHDKGTLVTSTNGAHTHDGWVSGASCDWKGGGSCSSDNRTSFYGSTTSNGAHTHTITGNTGNAGANQYHENRMEYMILNYAIKY
jgi:microcystin-dependent protein